MKTLLKQVGGNPLPTQSWSPCCATCATTASKGQGLRRIVREDDDFVSLAPDASDVFLQRTYTILVKRKHPPRALRGSLSTWPLRTASSLPRAPSFACCCLSNRSCLALSNPQDVTSIPHDLLDLQEGSMRGQLAHDAVAEIPNTEVSCAFLPLCEQATEHQAKIRLASDAVKTWTGMPEASMKSATLQIERRRSVRGSKISGMMRILFPACFATIA